MADQNHAGNVPVMNVRSPAQWAVLGTVMDFKGKTVLDVGCGYGDLLLFAKEAGASVTGIDNNPDIVGAAKERGLAVIHGDICQCLEGIQRPYDVAFCFSVLPYVDEHCVLSGLARVTKTAFIEAQLCGDGPGTFYTEGDLEETLLRYWSRVERVGETKVVIRNTIRAIWMCSTPPQKKRKGKR